MAGKPGDVRALTSVNSPGICCVSTLQNMQALILIELFPSSLLLVSIYGVLDNIVRLAFGSVIGQYVDRSGMVTVQYLTNLALSHGL